MRLSLILRAEMRQSPTPAVASSALGGVPATASPVHIGWKGGPPPRPRRGS